MAPADNPVSLYAKFELYMHKKDPTAAVKTLDEIIIDLKTNSVGEISKTLLIVYLYKRVKINFDLKNYQAVVEDCSALENLNENLYNEKDIFLIKEQSIMTKAYEEARERFSKAKLEFPNDKDIDFISTKIDRINIDTTSERVKLVEKPPVKKPRIG